MGDWILGKINQESHFTQNQEDQLFSLWESGGYQALCEIAERFPNVLSKYFLYDIPDFRLGRK